MVVPHIRCSRPVGRALAAALLGAALVALLFDTTHAWFHGGKFLSRDLLGLLLWWVPVVLLAGRVVRAAAEPPATWTAGDRDRVIPVLGGLLLLGLVCNATRHPWFYFHGWLPEPGVAYHHHWYMLERFLLLTTLLVPLLLRPRRLAGWLLLALLVAQAAAFLALWRTTGGLPLYRDDHPSFMFRLHEFVGTFPRRVSYNPHWNAGVVSSTGTSSGVFGVGLALFPIWKVWPVHAVYTAAVGFLFIIVSPLLSVLALRAVRASWTAALAAGLLALGVSRYYFVWSLHFGTIGAGFAVAFLPPAAALTYRVLVLRRADLLTLAGWVVCAFFLVQWPPGLIMAALLVPGALWNLRRWRGRPVGRLALAGLVLALLLVPAALTILHGQDLLAFVAKGAPAGADGGRVLPAWPVWWHQLRKTFGTRLIETHPLVACWGVAGAAVLPWRRLRRWFLPPIVLLLLLSAWGPMILPKLQLERMAIAACVLAAVPAALWIGRLLQSRRPGLVVVRAGTLALLLLGAYNVRQLYRAKGYAPFTWQQPEIARLVDWVQANVPADGRLLFVGPNIHAYGHGHIAYLPILAGREMMSSDYYAFPPELVDYQYPPRPFRDTPEGVARFARLHRVTHLICYRKEHIGWLRAAPALFRERTELQADGFGLFEVRDPAASLFTEGRGRVRARFNRLDLTDLAGETVAVRYNWDPRLRADPPAEIFPWDAGDGVTFLGIRPHGAASAAVRFGGEP